MSLERDLIVISPNFHKLHFIINLVKIDGTSFCLFGAQCKQIECAATFTTRWFFIILKIIITNNHCNTHIIRNLKLHQIYITL